MSNPYHVKIPSRERINELLASLEGWTKVTKPGPYSKIPRDWWQYKNDETTWGTKPPNYYEDLNALHRLEKDVLDKDIMDPKSPRYAYSALVYNLCPPEIQPMRAPASICSEALARVFFPQEFDPLPPVTMSELRQKHHPTPTE